MRSKSLCCLLGLLACLLSVPLPGLPFVQEEFSPGRGNYWPEKEATITLGFGCPENRPLTYLGPCWDDVAQHAAAAWNAVGQFRFHTRLASTAERESCRFDIGANVARWTLPACDERLEGSTLAITFTSTREGVITSTTLLVNHAVSWSAYPGPLRGPRDFYRIILHEFGHVLGLAHPDDHGQRVRAVMNAKISDIDCLQPDDIAGVQAIYGHRSGVTQGPDCGGEEDSGNDGDDEEEPDPTSRTGFLENPGPHSFKSGIGVISGWVCDARRVEVRIGPHRMRAAYGTERLDTRGVCGDMNNGFAILFNWNRLGDGTYRARLFVDGRQLGDPVAFTVTTFGEEFLRGAAGVCHAEDFPTRGTDTTLVWDQNAQSFVPRHVEKR